jgi:hypothetical protein
MQIAFDRAQYHSALLICLLVATMYGTSIAQTPQQTNAAVPSDAKKAFENMKTLAGSWQGTVMDMSVNATITVVSSGSAILYEATAVGGRPPDHEITVLYVEGDRLLATHFCDGGNRSRMEAKVSPNGNTVDFNTLDVAGGTKRGFTKRLALTIIDANHHIVELTYMMPDGKPVEVRGEFQRTK